MMNPSSVILFWKADSVSALPYKLISSPEMLQMMIQTCEPSQNRQYEEALSEILRNEAQLDTKQSLEIEIQELKGKLQVMKHLGDDDDEAVKQKMKEIHNDQEDKKSKLEGLEKMNSALIIKERQSNDEIQAVRKKIIAIQISLLVCFWVLMHCVLAICATGLNCLLNCKLN